MKHIKTFITTLVLLASAMVCNVQQAFAAEQLFVGTAASASYRDTNTDWLITVNDDKGNTLSLDINTGGQKIFAGTYVLTQCVADGTFFKAPTGQASFTALSVTVRGNSSEFYLEGTGTLENGAALKFLYGADPAELEALETADVDVNIEGPANTSITWNIESESWQINMPERPALKLDIKTGGKDSFAGTYYLVDCNANNTKHGTRTFTVLKIVITGTPTYCEITGRGKRNDGKIVAFHYASPKAQDIEIAASGMSEATHDGSAWKTSIYDYVYELKLSYRAASTAFAGTYTLADCVNASLLNYNTSAENTFTSLSFTITGEPNRAREIDGQGTLDNGADVVFHYQDLGEEVKISNAGYITYFSSDKNVQLTTGLEGYVAYMEEGELQLEQVYSSTDVIPAGTPVILKGQGTGMLMYNDVKQGKTPEKNDLRGSDRATLTVAPGLGDCYYYGLSLDKDHNFEKAGFYWMNPDGGAFTNQPHKAYLAVPKSAGARMSYTFAESMAATVEIDNNRFAKLYGTVQAPTWQERYNAYLFTFGNDQYNVLVTLETGGADKFAGTYTLANCTQGDYWTGLQNVRMSTYSAFTEIEMTITGTPEACEITGSGKAKDGKTVSFHIKNYMDLSVSEAGYATFYNEMDGFVIPAGLEGYVAYVEDGALALEKLYSEGETVPQATPVVLKGAKGDYSLVYTDTDIYGVTPTKNHLHGSDEATLTVVDGDNYYYVLSLNAEKELDSVGFYWKYANGAAFMTEAHKAYLAVPKTANARSGYAFNGTTSISTIEAESAQGVAFNLAGQRTNAAKGLVIREGKMMFVK